jgi:fermentation-respiration switch protein FrsA (DUF1100 family)
MTTNTDTRRPRLLGLALPTLAVTGGVGALGYLRRRFQRSRVFLPNRYPDGVWEPHAFGLRVDDVWFEADDGVKLHGWWIPHPAARGTILYCHGNTGSIAHRIGVFRHLQRLRVNLFAFDYRGYGRSSGSPSEAGLFRDVRAAFDHTVNSLERQSGEILLFGHSLGGAVAVDCALHRPAAGLVVQSSFTHIRDAAKAMFPTLPLHLAATREFRSIDKVGRIAIPKLFIHGDCDESVPVELGEKLFAAASDPKELYIVRRAGHNDVHRYGGLRYLHRLSRFRNRCLKQAG